MGAASGRTTGRTGAGPDLRPGPRQPVRSLTERYAYMKQITTLAIVTLLFLFCSGLAEARKPWPRLSFEQIQGEWIGQDEFGDVFRLNLESESSGSIGYVRPQWEDEGVRAWAIAELEFDGVTIKISVLDREFGDFVLVGFARANFMDLKIKGLSKSKIRIRFLRPNAWEGSLDRLRSGMET